MIHSIWQQFPKVEQQLAPLPAYLAGSIQLRNQAIADKIEDFLHSGGKLLRPGYFFLFSAFGPKQQPTKLIAGAAAIELLHLATLIHDDVIDDSPLRRNVTTIHTQYGQRNAIYAGDYLFTVYFSELIKSIDDISQLEASTLVMHDILNGELDQMNLNYNVNATVDSYLTAIEGKTAKLFELGCSQGARLTDAPDSVIAHASQIGRLIGMAYQIQDDILDFSASPAELAKPILEDVREGVYTLPLLFALQSDLKTILPLLNLKGRINDQQLKTIQTTVMTNGAINKAKELANQYTNQAIDLITQLPEIPERETLITLTNQLLTRHS